MAWANILGGLAGGLGNQMTSSANFGMLQSMQGAQDTSSTMNQMAQMQAQMQSEKTKTAAQIFQIQQETKTKVSEMQRETWVNKRKSTDKIHEKVKQLMMS